MTGETRAGSSVSARAKDGQSRTDPAALAMARELALGAGRRVHPPVRKSFACSAESGPAPVAQLVGIGGRGGAVALKLYLALLWRCSAEPFDTDISARRWASLLSLPDPNGHGARRVTDALRTLNQLRLVKVTPHRGESSTVQLLREDGSGHAYSLPSTAYTKASKRNKQTHIYFKVPTTLWTQGHLQMMSAPALAMLLALLAEGGGDGREVWWSTELFPERYSLAPATRSKGTTELKQRRLLSVRRRLVAKSPGQSVFARQGVRNVYQLIGDATTNGAKRPRPRPRKIKATPAES
jgi:hypothetical protein